MLKQASFIVICVLFIYYYSIYSYFEFAFDFTFSVFILILVCFGNFCYVLLFIYLFISKALIHILSYNSLHFYFSFKF